MTEELEASKEEIRRANDELWGYIQANPEIHVRAHMTRNLSFLYEKAYASIVDSKQSQAQELEDVSTVSSTRPSPGSPEPASSNGSTILTPESQAQPTTQT